MPKRHLGGVMLKNQFVDECNKLIERRTDQFYLTSEGMAILKDIEIILTDHLSERGNDITVSHSATTIEELQVKIVEKIVESHEYIYKLAFSDAATLFMKILK